MISKHSMLLWPCDLLCWMAKGNRATLRWSEKYDIIYQGCYERKQVCACETDAWLKCYSTLRKLIAEYLGYIKTSRSSFLKHYFKAPDLTGHNRLNLTEISQLGASLWNSFIPSRVYHPPMWWEQSFCHMQNINMGWDVAALFVTVVNATAYAASLRIGYHLMRGESHWGASDILVRIEIYVSN